jgi:hypothetical protein
MQMKISKFTLDALNSDGDCDGDIEFSITNTTNVNVNQIRHSEMYFDSNGNFGGGNNDGPTEVDLKPGKTHTFSEFLNIKKNMTSARNDIKVISSIRLMDRNLIDLGKYEIPKSDSEDLIVQIETKSNLISSPIQLRIERDKPDEDGDFWVRIYCCISNMTQVFFDAVELEATLLNAKGSIEKTNKFKVQVPPLSMSNAETAFMVMKSSKIGKGQINISLSIFSQVGHATLEAISKPGK